MARGITGLSLSLSLSLSFHSPSSTDYYPFPLAAFHPLPFSLPLAFVLLCGGFPWAGVFLGFGHRRLPPRPCCLTRLRLPPFSLLPSSLRPSPPSARFFQLLLPIFTADKFWGFHQHFLILEINNHFPLPSSK